MTFSYPTRSEEIALRDASLFFPAGETTFVIGKSGSGKSTLGQLLVRFYQPRSGQIFLDGVKLEHLDVRWLRENVTLVEQHSTLFNESIQHNIALGKQGETVELQTIREAIRFSMLDPIIQDLSEGLGTNLGMTGNSLSGGQKQRVALARARVRDSPVLILDESTSALDYVTRATILQAIREWRKGKTTIVITHDITQIQTDDFLYLLDKAQVVQEGYRKNLESRDGPFQAFLASHEERENREDDDFDNTSEYEDYTDELMSLYDDSWNAPSSRQRPMSAIMFGASVLSPFNGRNRDLGMESEMTGLEKRITTYGSNQNLQDLSRGSVDEGTVALKPRPGIPSTASGALQSKGSAARPMSSFSQHFALSRSPSVNRPWPASKDFGSRRSSIVSARPMSHHTNYPRPLSMVDGHPIRRKSPPKWDSKLLSRIRHPRRKNKTSGAQVPTGSLSIMEILRSVWPSLNWRMRAALSFAVVCSIVHAAAVPIFGWVFAQLLATFNKPDETKNHAIKYALAILGIAVVDGIVTWLLFFLSDVVAQSWALSLKTEAMKRILLQPREFFDQEENSVSRIAETLDHFAEEARNLPGRFASIFLIMFIMIGIAIVWSLISSWKLALVGLAMTPILYTLTQCYNMISSKWERLANEADDVVGHVMHETFVNIRTVRCLVLEDYFRKKYHEATTAAVKVGIKRAIYSGSIFGLNYSGVIFVAILLFWYGGLLISRDDYTVKAIMESFLVLLLSINHANFMVHYITQVNISREAGSRLIRLVRLPSSSHERTGTTKIHAADDISFTEVSFTYPTRKEVQVLHNVTFNIPRGSCTAIVGSSGSGKSTIASLLLKLYQIDPHTSVLAQHTKNHSDLTISGHNIGALDTSMLRSRMASVPQTPVLYPGTIAENIAYGLSPSSPLATIENIRAAADAAGVGEFIDSLPQGYQTLIGEGGTTLSGGQAQRLAIARALVRDPDILLLDEATSALDVTSAGIVRETILKLVRNGKEDAEATSPGLSPRSRSGGLWEDKEWHEGVGRGVVERTTKKMTVIIITHARQMMAIADHIVMLDKGRVVEQGSFRELRKKNGGAFGRLLRGESE